MKKMMLAGTLIMALVAAAAWAEQGPQDTRGGGAPGRGHHWYDPTKAETIKGQVVQVTEFESRNGMHKAVGLTVNAGGKTVTVHLGPQFYLEKQQFKIADGDQVEITGVRTMRGDQEIFVAGQVKKGGQVLKLHDENGRPLWAGQGPGPASAPAPDAGQKQRKAPVGC
jgi:hypothetical protein